MLIVRYKSNEAKFRARAWLCFYHVTFTVRNYLFSASLSSVRSACYADLLKGS